MENFLSGYELILVKNNYSIILYIYVHIQHSISSKIYAPTWMRYLLVMFLDVDLKIDKAVVEYF